jgi:Lamin Tail Domain/PKD domain
MRCLLLVLFWSIPALSQAAVILSEVAWMGSSASANHEWIELHNTDGADVDVSGWTLSDGMNLSIALSGIIAANSYAVLERTSDDSVSGTAFLIYTGALVNTGATLTLTRSDGATEDQVAGGEAWLSIGGDNTTKETAQYTTAGWVTGAPTPGRANAGTVREPEEEQEETNEPDDTDDTDVEPQVSSARKGSSSETVRLVLTDAMLSLKIDAQKKGYVNQPIEFKALPSGVGTTITNSLVYQWNFGDGGVTLGSNPTHTFSFPGTYIVTVYGAFKRQEQLARHEITILPVAVSVTRSSAGDVQINNDSPYEIDVSGYEVKGETSWRFPDYSIILPNQTVTLKRAKIGGGTVRVFDAQGVIVATSGVSGSGEPDTPLTPPLLSSPLLSRINASPETTPLVLAPTAGEKKFGFVDTALASKEAPSSSEMIKISKSQPALLAEAKSVPKDTWPYLALIGVILLGLFGTATKRSRNQSE